MNAYASFLLPEGRTEPVFEIKPDVAEALILALRNAIKVEPPRHATDLTEQTAVIAQATRVIQHLEHFRELAIVQADTANPHADRRALGIAAGMPPSRLYRILERYGRPRRRAAN